MIDYLFSNPFLFLILIIALLTAIAIHEFSHALTADYLGDPTPRLQGRLNLNPLNHIDLTGLLFLFFFGFGWGKPVEIDSFNLKNPRKDEALISIAGPISNFILALLFSLILRLFNFFEINFLSTIGSIIIILMIRMNLVLGIFNLLPIYPLDGFKIVAGFLPEEKVDEWYELKKYGFIFLLLLILPVGRSSMLTGILNPLLNFFFNLLVPNLNGTLI